MIPLKIRFRYLTPTSPLHPKMTLTITLWNIIKPHPFWNNNISEPFRTILFWKDTLSLPYSPPPPPPKWPSLSHNSNIWKFRKDTLSLPYPPPHCTPRMTLAHISNIIKPYPTWNNLSEPITVSEHFRKIRFRYLTLSLCTSKMVTVLEHFRKIRFRYLTPPPPLHPQNDT